MDTIVTLLRQPIAQVMGWALLHFVWQGTLIACLTALALAALRGSAADVRYVVSTVALSLMLTMPAVTAMQLWRASTDVPGALTPCSGAESLACGAVTGNTASASAVRIDGGTAAPAPPTRTLPAPAMRAVKAFAPEPWLPLLVLGWICGVLALSLRLMSGWVLVQRMKSHGTLPASESWQATALRLSRRLHIGRPVRLLQSSLVGVPTVIGWIKPVVLLPASALAGLSPEQLEAILAHELAHIRRHDYLVNLLQTLVETLLFYHPAVWWVSRRIRIERENCCDDLAVSLCGDPYAYARALADLEELRGSGGQLVMAANGGSLVQRIRRLLGAPAHPGRSPGWLAGGATILLMLGIAGGAAGTNAFQSPPATPAAPAIARPGAPLSPYMPPGLPPAKAAVAPQAPEASGAEKAPTAMEMAGRRSVSAMAAASTAMSAVGGAGQTHHMFSSSNNGETLKVTYDGEIEFTDDDMDVRRLSPGGLLKIADGGFFAPHTIEFAADASGKLTRRFWLGMSERPFEPEGRLWTAKMLPRFIRQTGIGAPARVARIFKSKGSAGVLAEIALIEGSWGKRVYFTELLNSATLDSATLRQVLTQAGREIDSDYELASLLIGSADKLLVDEGARQAYFEAARSIGSDFEARRVYSSALKRGPVSAPILAGILDASRQIDSDFEQATLLIQIAKLQPLDNTTRGPFFSALATVQSDFEHRRVLGALAERSDLTPETTSAMLTSGATVQSDFEAATFLLQIAKQQSIEGALRVPFFRAVDSIGSPFERGRVLQAVAARSDASADTVMAALRAASTMGGGFEPSRVLLAIAQSHVLAGPAREAYIDAAQKLGDFEQGQVLAALVRSERANRR